MLRRVGYLKTLDPCTLDFLFYSLQKASFKAGSLLFEKGDSSTLVYFVIRGTVSFCINLYDSSLQRLTKFRQHTVGVEMSRRSKFTLRKPRNTVVSRIKQEKLVQLELDILGPGSVICAINTLLKSELNTHCVALTNTKVLILDMQIVEALSKCNQNLFRFLENTKKRYSHFNDFSDDFAIIPPVVDYYKHNRVKFTNNHLKRKFKNLVLQVIIRNRYRIVRSAMNCRALVSRIKAVGVVKQNGTGELAKLLDTMACPPKTMMLMNYLSPYELTNAFYIQFAGLANRALEVFNDIENRNEHDFQTAQRLDKSHKDLQLAIKEVNELLNTICRYA